MKGLSLGEKTEYASEYDKSLLFPIPRLSKRKEIGINSETLPFFGSDLWTAYEISWLDLKNKPQVAIGVFYIDCNSTNIIESKSLKLYLNSFNNTCYTSSEEVKKIISSDLSEATNNKVDVTLYSLHEYSTKIYTSLPGKNIDNLDIYCDISSPSKNILKTGTTETEEIITSDLLKSNCLVTNQPDWASVMIQYKGKKINHESLLKYIISYRNHNEFHEQCVERIFIDIMNACKPNELTVYARYTRRGGIDINPFRTNVKNKQIEDCRLVRQ
ncbi:MAG: NADPH-dependent 7-cyano-7-deazaguanine reductase QueF [Rickettsiales bacterium]